MAMSYTVQIKTDPRRHVQNPALVPWITRAMVATKREADRLATECRQDGLTVRVVAS